MVDTEKRVDIGVEKSEDSNIKTQIHSYVNTNNFAAQLFTSIMSVEKADVRAKLMLELVAYTVGKIKAEDSDDVTGIDSIEINFYEAKPEDEVET